MIHVETADTDKTYQLADGRFISWSETRQEWIIYSQRDLERGSVDRYVRSAA